MDEGRDGGDKGMVQEVPQVEGGRLIGGEKE